jgi:hypothetical protein
MDSEIFHNYEIYYSFKEEWIQKVLPKEHDSDATLKWEEFILNKDLGVISYSGFYSMYKIIDHKKWLLAKLKYGF